MAAEEEGTRLEEGSRWVAVGAGLLPRQCLCARDGDHGDDRGDDRGDGDRGDGDRGVHDRVQNQLWQLQILLDDASD